MNKTLSDFRTEQIRRSTLHPETAGDTAPAPKKVDHVISDPPMMPECSRSENGCVDQTGVPLNWNFGAITDDLVTHL